MKCFLRYGHDSDKKEKEAKIQKEEPNFKLSGKLTEYTNTYNVRYKILFSSFLEELCYVREYNIISNKYFNPFHNALIIVC